MTDEVALGAAFSRWMLAWLAITVASITAALVLPTERLARQLRDRMAQIDATRAGRWALVLSLTLIGAMFRLPFLDADLPARMLTYSAAFGSDEGVWAFVATEWCVGRNPIGGPEYLAGAMSLPFTVLQFVSCKLFGVSIASVRIVSALAGTALGPMIYLGVRRWLGPVSALTAGLLLATHFLLAMYQRTGMTDGVLAVTGAGVLILYHARATPGRRWIVVAGMVAGLAIWLKISAIVLLGGIAASTLLCFDASGAWKPRPCLGGFFGVGVLIVAMAAGAVYSMTPGLAAAASAAVSLNVHPLPYDPLEWLWRVIHVLNMDTSFLHTPLLMTAALGSIVVGLIMIKKRATLQPGLLFAGGWWLALILMLAGQGYVPTRYYLQSILPLILIAVAGLAAAWRWLDTRSWETRRVRALIVAVVASEILFSAWRYGDWLVDRQYTQRDVGMAIAQLARADATVARVSGPWAFNLALSGGFAPMGFRGDHPATISQAAAVGATHFLTAGPIPEDQLPRQGPVRLRLRGQFRYYDNYFDPKADLHLYAMDHAPP